MKYEIVIKEYNSIGVEVRDVPLMRTSQKGRALSFFNDKVIELGYYGNSRSALILFEWKDDNKKVVKRYEG